MKTTLQQPVAVACLFIWIGFVAAISFMEAWLKFRAPGVTLPLGLGIGRLVFGALNTVEWIFTMVVVVSAVRYSQSVWILPNISLLTIIVVLTIQTLWLLPALDARAAQYVQGKLVASSSLHAWFVGAEFFKVTGLFIAAVSLFKPKMNAVAIIAEKKLKPNQMNISKDDTIGAVVAEDYRTANTFEQAGIDFCCKGERTIETACAEQKIPADELLHQLQQIVDSPLSKADAINSYHSWPLDLLVDFIEKKHHRYVATQIPILKSLLEKLMQVHGERHPELVTIKENFDNCAGELSAHMKKEELLLFPFIRKMVLAKLAGKKDIVASFGTVQNPIRMMMHEHDVEGERFRTISRLSNQYNPPTDGCGTYKATFATLKEFEDDLHLHIHLENNILFPKAIELEQSFHEQLSSH